MKIGKYLRNLGFDTISESFYGDINRWMQYYKGSVAGFHNYKMYNGTEHIRRKRYGLKMAKKLCEDIANMLLNEKVLIIVDETEGMAEGENGQNQKATNKSQEFVNAVLKKNRWWKKGNEYQEKKAACGTVAYVADIANAVTDESGVITGGEVKIKYVMAPSIWPITWENGYVSECAFVFRHVVKGKAYNHLQIHTLEDNGYVIENHVVEATQAELGNEIPMERWADLKPFKDMAQRIETGSFKRQFVIDMLNIANNISDEEDSPMGVSIYANSLDDLKATDVIYDSYVNEFVLGKKRVYVSSEILQETVSGAKVFDPNDVTFYRLPEEMGRESGKYIVESNMELRSDEHNRAMNDALNILSVKTGFGTQHYRFEHGQIATATEVISENSDLFRTLKKHEILLDDVLVELVEIILRLGITTGAKVNPDAQVRIAFDDSIIEDKNAERERDRADVAMGAMSLSEYRAKWYGEPEDVAKTKIVTEGPELDPVEE